MERSRFGGGRRAGEFFWGLRRSGERKKKRGKKGALHPDQLGGQLNGREKEKRFAL